MRSPRPHAAKTADEEVKKSNRIVRNLARVAEKVAEEAERKKVIPIAPAEPEGEREASGEAKKAKETIDRYMAKVKNPMTAIRACCIECSGGSVKEVTLCRVKSCALHPFREGKNPFRKDSSAFKAAQANGESDDTDE